MKIASGCAVLRFSHPRPMGSFCSTNNTFPEKDGSVRELAAPQTIADFTKDLSMGLYRNACCALVDGKVADLCDLLDHDCAVEILTFDSEQGQRAFNHTASHILAQAVQHLFPDKQKDFVFNVSETDIVLVKEVKPGVEGKDLEKLARSIVDTLGGEFYTKAQVGIGSVIEGIKDLARSFREAQAALEVGKVFDTEKLIVSYDNLGIARIIYQLPTTLCEQYLREVFKKGSIENLDHETLFTIQKFFENNLNVSETSRKLFVHRNTLVYRLEKIKKLTGLDLREFDHAIIFKVALMVKKYLTANPVKY